MSPALAGGFFTTEPPGKLCFKKKKKKERKKKKRFIYLVLVALGMWDLSYPIRDQTWVLCIGSMES